MSCGIERGWLVECECELDVDDDDLMDWKDEHPDFVTWTWDWVQEHIVDQGLLVATSSAGFGCPDDGLFLVATEESAKALGTKDPAVASGNRPITEVCYVCASFEAAPEGAELEILELIQGLDQGAVFYGAGDPDLVALPATSKNESVLKRLFCDGAGESSAQ